MDAFNLFLSAKRNQSLCVTKPLESSGRDIHEDVKFLRGISIPPIAHFTEPNVRQEISGLFFLLHVIKARVSNGFFNVFIAWVPTQKVQGSPELGLLINEHVFIAHQKQERIGAAAQPRVYMFVPPRWRIGAAR